MEKGGMAFYYLMPGARSAGTRRLNFSAGSCTSPAEVRALPSTPVSCIAGPRHIGSGLFCRRSDCSG